MSLSLVAFTSASHSSAPAPAYPTNAVNDQILLWVANKPDTITPTTPTNWTLVGTGSTPDVRITCFYRNVTSVLSGSQTVTVGAGSCQASMQTWRATGGVFATPTWATGSDSTSGTAFSATATSTLSFAAGDILAWSLSLSDDLSAVTPDSITATGVTFGSTTEMIDAAYTGGSDIRFATYYAEASSGSGTVAPVFAATLSVATVGPAGFVLVAEPAVAVARIRPIPVSNAALSRSYIW